MKTLTTRFLILCLALTAWPAFAQNLVSDQDPLTSLAEDDVLYVVDDAGAYDGKVDVSVLRSELLKQRGGANFQTGTSYTLQLSDAGKVVELANASAITLTIPANSSVAFPVNTVIELVQGGAGAVTIGITDDTLNGATSISAQWGSVLLWKRAATEWVATVVDPSGLSEAQVDARVVAVAPQANQDSNVGPATVFVVGPTIVDDGVYELDFGTSISAAHVIVSNNTNVQYGIFAIRAHSASAHCVAMVSNDMTAQTGVLTGTTGVDGEVTISTHTDNKLYIENRAGGTSKFMITVSRAQTP